MISSNGSCDEDIERCEKAFLRQFYSIYRKFHFIDNNVLLYLFNAHCTSFYGSELWIINKYKVTSYKSTSICFHDAIKKIYGIPRQESNHFVCNNLNILTFDHFIHKKMINFYFNIIESFSLCFAPFLHYFIKNSFMHRKIKKLCHDKYGINDIYNNDVDAIFARIARVQKEESCSLPLFLRNIEQYYNNENLVFFD